MLPLELTQVAEQDGYITGIVFIDPVQAHEGIEDEEPRSKRGDGRGEAVPVPANMGLTQSLHSPLHTHDGRFDVDDPRVVVRDFTLQEIFELLGRISGIKPPGLKIPRWSVLPFAYLSERVSNWMTKTPPRIPLEGVKMAKQYMFFDASKAVRELGLPQSPIEQALKRAVQWFFENGYVKPHRMVKIRLRSP